MPNAATVRAAALTAGLFFLSACGGGPKYNMSTVAPSPDPRVGLRAGMFNAAEATWNMRVVSRNPSQGSFAGVTNSDLSFSANYAIQGNYNGFQVWDISNPAKPTLKIGYVCPASQSDVSVYKNMLFVSGEGQSGRLDCGTGGVHDSVSTARLRGIRIFDITDITAPKYLANVQTCRGSHTHTVVEDPNDKENVYVYVSGSSGVRSPSELAGCVRLAPDEDANSALFRIEVIKVPLAHPEQARIVSSPRIFNDLTEAKAHSEPAADIADAAREAAAWRAKGGYTAKVGEMEYTLGPGFVAPMLDSIVRARQGTGAATAADSAALRSAIQGIVDARYNAPPPGTKNGIRPGPTQCHDITVYPAIGLAGGACGGYGLLLDIHDVANPRRLAAVADSNFSYWHSATFNNDGTKLLFSDEWGGGGGPKCRATDKPEWGADAIFTLSGNTLQFQSYYKMLAPQTVNENCVAHNGSLIPIPGRDVMVQSWYQGGISVFDWTDAAHPKEIAFFDRGPADSTTMGNAGTWSAYWYNGVIVSSEIGRGLDIVELLPSGFISQNELDAAKLVHLTYFNTQDQPKIVWPASFVVARAYVDQLARSNGLAPAQAAATRDALARAEKASGQQRHDALTQLMTQLNGDLAASADAAKVRMLFATVTELAK